MKGAIRTHGRPGKVAASGEEEVWREFAVFSGVAENASECMKCSRRAASCVPA